MSAKRIAIFQHEWPIQSQTANCAIVLREAGYEVDLFLYRNKSYINLSSLQHQHNVNVYYFADQRNLASEATVRDHQVNSIKQIASLCRLGSIKQTLYHFYYLQNKSHYNLLRGNLIPKTLQIIRGKKYDFFIGIEKQGLVWAGQIAEKTNTPFLYYSLEIDPLHEPKSSLERKLYVRRLRSAERFYHKKAYGTIIQDEKRASALFQLNQISAASRVFHVPVSILDHPVVNNSKFFHKLHNLSPNQKIALYFGLIAKERFALELTKQAQLFPDNWILVMHGEGNESLIRKIKALDKRKKVIISNRLLPSETLPEVISSANVGLAFYQGNNINDRCTIFASEKIASYLCYGLPFIGFNFPEYTKLLKEIKCGVLIKSINELPEAIAYIDSSLPELAAKAKKAFHKYYNYRKNFRKVLQAIEAKNHSCSD